MSNPEDSSLEEGEIPESELGKGKDDMKTDESTPNITLPPAAKERGFEKVWKVIESSTADWATWTKLLSLADNEESIDEIRKAYNTFLSEFPLCYVYWKKFADHELSKGNPANVIDIYERALSNAIPHSVDLWTHYCSYVAEKSDNLDEIRKLFERGLNIVGNDFAAHPLWDKYIEFESSQEEYRRIGNIFYRILQIPLEQINSYWERYKSFVSERPLADIATPEEIESVKKEKIDNIDKQKGWVVGQREKIFMKVAEEAAARRLYEQEVLKVNYFHVRPLDENQLSNWTAYLEFEERRENHDQIVKLYERCIIPCCNYSKFWLKYIRYLERYGKAEAAKKGSLDSFKAEDARKIFERACNVFLKRRPDIHLEFAAFEEQYGNLDKARSIYAKLNNLVPGHIESTLRYINLERRQSNFAKCEELYSEALKVIKDDSQSVFLYIHYARLMGSVYDTPKRAREIFSEAIDKYAHFREMWIAYIHFEKNLGGADVEERVSSIYDQAVHHNKVLAEENKIALLLDWIEYCADEGRNIQRFRDLSHEYREKCSYYEGNHASRGVKRAFDETGAEMPPSKMPRTDQYGYDPMSADYSNYYYYNPGYDYSAYSNFPQGGYGAGYDPTASAATY